jgi:hypothetical protein
MVSKSTAVIALFGIGPLHLVIVLVVVVPSGFVNTNVPQKAKDVRLDPVLLLIDRNKCLVIILPAAHEPQASSPALGGSVALTNNKSPDVQEVAGGSVCANVPGAKNIIKEKISTGFLKKFQSVAKFDKRVCSILFCSKAFIIS